MSDILLPENKFGVLSGDKHSLYAAYSVSAVCRFADGDLLNRPIQPIQQLVLPLRGRLGVMLCDWHVIKITVLCILFELKS